MRARTRSRSTPYQIDTINGGHWGNRKTKKLNREQLQHNTGETTTTSHNTFVSNGWLELLLLLSFSRLLGRFLHWTPVASTPSVPTTIHHWTP